MACESWPRSLNTSDWRFLALGDHPKSRKKRSENGGANENLSCGFPSIPGVAPGVAQRIVFVLLKSWDAIPRMEFRIPRMEFLGGLQKGAGGRGPRQKNVNIVKKCQKVFRHFSTNFARQHFSGPFLGGSEFRIPRAAPRIPWNSPRAPRMAFSLRERFPEFGVVPRLLRFRPSKIPTQREAMKTCLKAACSEAIKGCLAKGYIARTSSANSAVRNLPD